MKRYLILCMMFLCSISLAQNRVWTKKTPMPEGRSGFGASVVDGKIYVVGGIFTSGGLPSVSMMYDPILDTWTTKEPIPTTRWGLSTSVVNGKIYAIGGNGWKTTTEEYDPVTNTWTTKAPMNVGKQSCITAVVDGKIYAFGGVNGTAISSVEMYDPATDVWMEKAPLPTSRGFSSAAVMDGKIYVIGGDQGGNTEYLGLSVVEVYDPVTDSWDTTKTDMITARTASAACNVGQQIFVIGGGPDIYGSYSHVEMYDHAQDTWFTKWPIPTARQSLRSCTINGKIYVMGGYQNFFNPVALSVLEVYEPMLDPTGIILNCTINNSFQSPNLDTLWLKSDIVSPQNQNIFVYADIESSDLIVSDTVQMFDDGIHEDGLANDGMYGGYWLVKPLEKNFDIHIEAFLVEDNHPVVWDHIEKFTTKGPIVLEQSELTSIDTIANPNDRLKYSLTMKNMGITDTVYDMDAKLILADSSLSDVTFGDPEFGDVAPGESINSSVDFAIKIDANCTPGFYEVRVEITSEGIPYWTDSFTIEVVQDPTDIKEISNLPKEYALLQNYPNPFNPTTSIIYALPVNSIVSVKIYDIIGNLLYNLVNEQKEAGYHSLEFDASKLPSGVYFYQLKAGSFIDTKKMILLK